MNMFSQWYFFIFNSYMPDVIMKRKSLILNNVLQICVGILMLCINCFLNNRNCRYYEKKVYTLMVNHATYINKRMVLPVPSQYLDFQRYMSWFYCSQWLWGERCFFILIELLTITECQHKFEEHCLILTYYL
jgi:hypothetical protein